MQFLINSSFEAFPAQLENGWVGPVTGYLRPVGVGGRAAYGSTIACASRRK